MVVIRIYIIGISVLVLAIGANTLAKGIGLKTWYDFLLGLSEKGWDALQLRVLDLLWLFVLYPLALGGSATLGDWLYERIF